VYKDNGLALATQDIIGAANVYIRYFLIYLQGMVEANKKPDYALEISQLPKCEDAMEKLRRSPSDLKPLAESMGTQTIIAAALYIMRCSLEQQGKTPAQIPAWQSPAAKEAPAVMAAPQPMAADTTLDRNRREIRIRWPR
jgi:hypothetical protein